jgi:hypothetical protein
MIFPKTIQDGEAVIRLNQNGTRNIIPGPKTIFAPFTRIEPLHRLNSAEGDYLVITYRDGHTEHKPGPEELALLQEANLTAWPPRLPDQPIFYPVMNHDLRRKNRHRMKHS